MDIVTEKCLSLTDWTKWMNEFSIKVKNGTYSKMEYQLWKKCAKGIKGKEVVLQLTDFPTIRLYEDDVFVVAFSPSDAKFGSFLYDMMFNEEEKNLALNNNIGINFTASNSFCDTTLIRDGGSGYSSFITADKNTSIAANTVADTAIYISDKADKYEVDCLASRVSALEAEKKEKEEKKMSMFNFDFGPCTNNDVRLSMYGLAIRNTAGE